MLVTLIALKGFLSAVEEAGLGPHRWSRLGAPFLFTRSPWLQWFEKCLPFVEAPLIYFENLSFHSLNRELSFLTAHIVVLFLKDA